MRDGSVGFGMVRQFKEGHTNIVVDGVDYNVPTDEVWTNGLDGHISDAYLAGFTAGIRQARKQGELF